MADWVKSIRYGWVCWNQHQQLANSWCYSETEQVKHWFQKENVKFFYIIWTLKIIHKRTGYITEGNRNLNLVAIFPSIKIVTLKIYSKTENSEEKCFFEINLFFYTRIVFLKSNVLFLFWDKSPLFFSGVDQLQAKTFHLDLKLFFVNCNLYHNFYFLCLWYLRKTKVLIQNNKKINLKFNVLRIISSFLSASISPIFFFYFAF